MKFPVVCAAVVCGLLMVAFVAAAQFVGEPEFDLSWNSIDGGGGTSTGGTLSLSATIGQPDTGVPLTGGTFSLTGGFWHGTQSLCPADIIQTGAVNVDDLLAVINAWGACADPRNCPADIAPPGGNDAVNVDDLLAVINGWGACP